MQSIYFKNHRGQRIGVIVAVVSVVAVSGHGPVPAPTIEFGASFMHPEDQKAAAENIRAAKAQLAQLRRENGSMDNFGITVPDFWNREDATQMAFGNRGPALDFNKIPKQHRERAALFVSQVVRSTYRPKKSKKS